MPLCASDFTLSRATSPAEKAFPYWFCDTTVEAEVTIEVGVYGSQTAPDPTAIESANTFLAHWPERVRDARLMLMMFREKGARWYPEHVEILQPGRDPLGASCGVSFLREDMPAAVEAVSYYVGFYVNRALYVAFRYE